MASKKNSRADGGGEPAEQQPQPESKPDTVNEVSSSSCPVVAFGASAGGLEAFTEVLQHMPEDTGMAFVLIQHLDPKHASMLSELLGRATRMPVRQADKGMKVEPNHVYVIPPNTNISISGGVLDVEPRAAGAPHMPIDHFFRALALDQGGKAFGVVLSGTASDGTLGLRAIKAEGGIAFAQEPGSARYDGMPRSAIAAGCVDFVLTPASMARELVRLCRHPYLSRPQAAVEEASPDGGGDFNGIFAMLRSATGVDFSYYKPGTIRRRTLRRMALHKLETPAQYQQYLRSHPQELDMLFGDILINVTGFFREPETFAYLKSNVLPAIFKARRQNEGVRIWVPGCATGEEVYSIAMCVVEYMRETRNEAQVQIFGTDISETALESARAGVFSEAAVAEISADRLRRFFVRVNGTHQVTRVIRDMCVFARQNVTKDPPFSRLDLIMCRNVLIYLGPVLQSKVMKLFHYALVPSGYLVLGVSESVGSAADLFAQVDRQHKIYSRKAAPAVITTDFGDYGEHAPRETGPRPEHSLPVDLQRRVDHILVARYAPAAVVVNRELHVLQFRGQTAAFLGHGSGEASLNLVKMARGGLGVEVRKLVRKAEANSAPVKSGPISVPMEDGVRSVLISVTPLHGLPEPQFLVVFEEEREAVHAAEPEPGTQPQFDAMASRVRELEQELTSTKEYLQAIIEEQEASTEELKSAHEEVQSSNEELQSTNEELLTAKEELQSTNEELTTVNEEMQNRNAELQNLNNDLINLLSSVNIPIIMLGNDLRVRRFTPQAEKILNLIPADIGRPISDFHLKIHAPDLAAICQDVIETLAARHREVQDKEGRCYSMWVRPYRTADSRIEGVVLAFLDLTEQRQVAEARYRRLFEGAKDGILIVHGETGEIVDANPYVTKLSGYPRTRLLGTKFWESDLFRDSDIQEGLLETLKSSELVHKSVRLPRVTGQVIDADVIASPFMEGENRVVQFNIRDISARKHSEESARREEEQLRQAQKMEAVGRLAGGVAHDFNNLLTAVLGYCELLEQEVQESAPASGMVAQIRAAAERAAILTKQLLAFGRKQVLRPAALQPNEIIGEMRQLLSVMMREGIELELVGRASGRVMMDRGQFEQVVMNLVLNARDAMPAGGRITVETSDVDVDKEFSDRHPTVPAGRYMAVTVKDTGTGMNKETKEHLFEPFFTTKPKGVGVGLGLSTVYGIVTQNRGYIQAYSELGVGSTFTVYLPRVEEQAGTEPAQPAQEAPGGTETILLAEDEPAVRQLARKFLEMRGYQVLEAGSGPDAIRESRAHKGRIDLLLTDVVMPRMSGRELAFQLAGERPEMRVLYMSGHTEDAIVHHGVLGEGVAFLQKPFTQEVLAARVRGVLEGKQ